MELKFKQVDDNNIDVIAVSEGKEKVVGNIFTPSSSGENLTNAIQICGFTEAFDLWGCARFQIPKSARYGMSIDGVKQSKDIQLQFI